MKVTFQDEGWEDYLHWQVHDRKLLVKINALIKECSRTPFTGTGKPEPLRANSPGGGLAVSMRDTALSTERPKTAC